MGYLAGGANVLDASNANTTGVVDPTNPVGTIVDRAVAKLNPNGAITTTDTWAYSGNNGRNAILANGLYYTAGNNNNGNQPTTMPFTPVLQELIASTGIQIVNPNGPTGNFLQAGTFSVTQYGFPADKPGKDTNFRGLTIFNNTLYTTKGSGSNGINTVYQVGATGTLPTAATAPQIYDDTSLSFPDCPWPRTPASTTTFPFGICFADANTLYVGDEGDGVIADAGVSTLAGLQKWILRNGTWSMAYVMQNGLNLGQQYSVANYPAHSTPPPPDCANHLPPELQWHRDRLRPHLDGEHEWRQGADPNKLVVINDVLANTNPSWALASSSRPSRRRLTGRCCAAFRSRRSGSDGYASSTNDQISGWDKSAVSVALSSPAPAGGLTLTLSSSDPTTVTVNPAEIYIAAGGDHAAGQLSSRDRDNLGAATNILNPGNVFHDGEPPGSGDGGLSFCAAARFERRYR